MTSPVNRQVADAQPGVLRWTLTLMGCIVLLWAWKGADLGTITRWIMALGGLAIVLLSPAAARSTVGGVRVTEEGVTGPGFLSPVFIPWHDVDRVFDDRGSITVQSKTRSARIPLSTVTVSSTFGGARLGNFANTEEIVRFVLSHIPKSALLEMRYWLPT
jgi:hypothetical protein